MIRQKKKTTILYILAVLLAAAGIVLGVVLFQMQNSYTQGAAEAEAAVLALDASNLEALRSDINALSEQIAALDTETQAEQEKLEQLQADIAQIQQAYETLLQEEDPAYYQAIIDSLTEGMNLVESYINGEQ